MSARILAPSRSSSSCSALIIGCVLVALVLKGLYSYLDAYENRHQPVQSPLVQQTTADTRMVEQGDIKKFPQPRLETDETTEINDFRMQEEQTLNSYGWVDQQAGVVRIPIDRAMALLAQRGLAHPAASRRGSAIGCKHGERSGAEVRYE